MKSRVIFLIVALGTIGCSKNSRLSDRGIFLPDNARITLAQSGKELAKQDADALRIRFRTLKPISKALYDVADEKILVYSDSSKVPQCYSVFLKDDVVYEGSFQDAWTDRMKDEESSCFALDPKTKEMLLRLRVSSEKNTTPQQNPPANQ
jgi:hypothetical protein